MIELALIAVLLATALATALLRDVLAAIVAFSAYSLAIAVVWVLLRAPDVGLTEAAVGAGVVTVLFLLAIEGTVRADAERTLARIDWPALGVALALVAVLAPTVLALPPVGAADTAVAAGDVTTHYVENAYDDTGVENVVTAVLAGYRGFDTLGEVTVVFAAGIGLLVVLGREGFA
ncbi:DUF4040 domain-containing protein [Halococcoides cellulosivorans]|uniref:Cation:proton antiporter n=1 Tax=Halococcoides cellulosivorans TaxID=1679096 RepID=A0A2R4WZ00_9EURY|nr:DUF4040 domain-containing protein [Halococcoides cellulosivorans]AWB26756.1 cation:proton antiporter [Halococcoides cellulosivorans]